MRQIKIKSISEKIEISGEDAKHLIYSLRSKVGERLNVIDEKGQRALVELIQFSKDKVFCRVIKNLPAAQAENIILAVSIPKNGFDTIIRQATEIGVAAIQPLITERTVSRPSLAKSERWKRIAIEAAQQSGSSEPIILPITNFTDWLKKIFPGTLIVCSESEDQKYITEVTLNGTATILIGSEGGFSKNELELLSDAGAISVSLGKNILRVDTAAISALSIIKAII